MSVTRSVSETLLTLQPLWWRHLPRHLPRGSIGNDSPAILVGDDIVDRQRCGAYRTSGGCCNILGVSFVLGIRVAIDIGNCIRVVTGAGRGLEIDRFDWAARSRLSALAWSRMAGD